MDSKQNAGREAKQVGAKSAAVAQQKEETGGYNETNAITIGEKLPNVKQSHGMRRIAAREEKSNDGISPLQPFVAFSFLSFFCPSLFLLPVSVCPDIVRLSIHLL